MAVDLKYLKPSLGGFYLDQSTDINKSQSGGSVGDKDDPWDDGDTSNSGLNTYSAVPAGINRFQVTKVITEDPTSPEESKTIPE